MDLVQRSMFRQSKNSDTWKERGGGGEGKFSSVSVLRVQSIWKYLCIMGQSWTFRYNCRQSCKRNVRNRWKDLESWQLSNDSTALINDSAAGSSVSICRSVSPLEICVTFAFHAFPPRGPREKEIHDEKKAEKEREREVRVRYRGRNDFAKKLPAVFRSRSRGRLRKWCHEHRGNTPAHDIAI